MPSLALPVPSSANARLAIRSTALVVIALGLAVLLGWAFDLALLKTVAPGMVAFGAHSGFFQLPERSRPPLL